MKKTRDPSTNTMSKISLSVLIILLVCVSDAFPEGSAGVQGEGLVGLPSKRPNK
jgi:hypothetical protein